MTFGVMRVFEGLTVAVHEVAGSRRGRLTVATLAILLVYAGVVRAFLSIGLAVSGGFPMPGDNLVMLASSLAVCGFAAIAPRRAQTAMRSTAGCASVVVLGTLSIAVVAISNVLDAGGFRSSMQFAAGVLMRLTGLVGLIAVEALSEPCNSIGRATRMGLAVVGAVAVDLACLLASSAGIVVAGAVLTVALLLLLFALRREALRVSGDSGEKPSVLADDPDGLEIGHRPFGVPFRHAAVLLALYGLLGGMSSSQSHSMGTALSGAPSLVRSCLANDVGLVVGAGLLMLGAAWLLSRSSDPFALRCVTLPLYVASVFLTPLSPAVAGVVVPVVMAASQVLFYGLLWMFPACCCFGTAHDGRAGAHMRLFAVGCCCFFGGIYLGMWLGGDLLLAVGSGDFYMVAAVVVFAAVLIVEFAPLLVGSASERGETAVGEKGVSGLLDGTAPVDGALSLSDSPGSFDSLLQCAADRWSLTPRERAVLPGLVRGRSVAWVADSLTVSKNTVHTHMRNIYQKAGVHSREELIDAVEAFATDVR